MKKFLALAISLNVIQCGFSQTEKGSYLIGGSLGFGVSTNNISNPISYGTTEQKQTNFSISPNISYFVVKRLSVGLMPQYVYSKTSVPSNNESRSNTFSIGPVARYYFLFNSLAVFPEASYSFGVTKVNTTVDVYLSDFSNSARLYSLKAGIGVAYFLNKNIGVEGRLYFQKNQNTYDHAEDNNGSYSMYYSNYTTTALLFNIGLQVYLNKKSKE